MAVAVAQLASNGFWYNIVLKRVHAFLNIPKATFKTIFQDADFVTAHKACPLTRTNHQNC
jgi:hypothetical protein